MDKNTEQSEKTFSVFGVVAETGSFNVTQAGLKVTEILLPQPFECRHTGLIYQTILKDVQTDALQKEIGQSLTSVIKANEDGAGEIVQW